MPGTCPVILSLLHIFLAEGVNFLTLANLKQFPQSKRESFCPFTTPFPCPRLQSKHRPSANIVSTITAHPCTHVTYHHWPTNQPSTLTTSSHTYPSLCPLSISQKHSLSATSIRSSSCQKSNMPSNLPPASRLPQPASLEEPALGETAPGVANGEFITTTYSPLSPA